MTVKEFFDNRNPFDNLTVASSSNANYTLRGHEDLLEIRKKEILDAIDHPSYPGTSQHTIVFGEWGHGKSHLLRIIENFINNERPSKAKAIFFEPADSNPEDVFISLCKKLEIEAVDVNEFVLNVKNKYPENLFLLIDETQALIGEGISEYLDKNMNEYWDFLGNLERNANENIYGLHIFHGLSSNSARAIKKIGKVETIKTFNKYLFTLQSLNEDDQWNMISDHIRENSINDNLVVSNIINRGVNQCLNEITGGNPRFVLSLMKQIFDNAFNLDKSVIDGLITYNTLKDTPRIDSSGLNYFDKHLINQVFTDLRNGSTKEKRIGELIEQELPNILGEWKKIEQKDLHTYNLTTAEIRKECTSLQRSMSIFEQPIGLSEFRLRHEFLNYIGVVRKKTLSENEDKSLLLELQLNPIQKIPEMMIGLKNIMAYNSRQGNLVPFNELEWPNYFYQTKLSDVIDVKVAFNVYKGPEIPINLYKLFLSKILNEEFTVVIIIEDTDNNHDLSGSSWQKFKNEYTETLDLDKRFLFINGTDSNNSEFDEDFFVKLVSQNKTVEDSIEWFKRLRISERLEKISEECIYCPNENEQLLIEELYKSNSSFKISEIKLLNNNIFDWVKKSHMDKLSDYITKIGSSYQIIQIDYIQTLKYILYLLQKNVNGLSSDEINKELSKKYIRTGSNQAINNHTNWLLDILKSKNNVDLINDLFYFKDNEKVLNNINDNYNKLLDFYEKEIEKYKNLGVDVSKLKEIEDKGVELKNNIDNISSDSIDNKILLYEAKISILENLISELEKIPENVKFDLEGQYENLLNFFNDVKEKTLIENLDINPYEIHFGFNLMKISIDDIKSIIDQPIPQQKDCRDKITTTRKNLEAFNLLFDQELKEGIYNEDNISSCILGVFNSIRDKKNVKLKIDLLK